MEACERAEKAGKHEGGVRDVREERHRTAERDKSSGKPQRASSGRERG